MKNLTFLTLFLLAIISFDSDWFALFEADYFVNATTGDNDNSGRYPWAAWKDFTPVNAATFSAGDRIGLRAGDNWNSSITIGQSGTSGNPITVKSYGNGEQPKIYGSDTITGWTLHSGNIYKATFATTINQLFLDDVRMKSARYPNTGFATITSISNDSTFTSTELNGALNYTGVIIHIHSSSYGLDPKTIQSSSSTTLTLNRKPYDNVDVGEKYVLMNKLEFLDEAGEWFYDDPTNTVYFWKPDSTEVTDTEVRGSTLNYGIYATGKNYIAVKNIEVLHQKVDGIYFTGCDYYNISGVTATDADANGIHDYNGNYGTVQYCSVTGSNHYGINIYSDTGHNQINHNTVRNVALYDDLGLSGIGAWYGGSGIFIQNSNVSTYTSNQINYARYNNVFDVGYNGIHFANEAVIEYNYVDRFCYTKNDGGGIYTASPTTLPVGSEVNKGSIIRHNICLNGYGIATNGTAYSEGIYLDETSGGITVEYNTVGYQTGRGIFCHDGNNHVIRYNTVFMCENGLYASRDGASITMRKNTVYGGLDDELFHKNAITGTMSIDSNTYINHYTADPFQIDFGTHYTFTNWKSTTGYDAASTFDNTALTAGHSEMLAFNPTGTSKKYYTNSATTVKNDITDVALADSFYVDPYTSIIVTGLNAETIADTVAIIVPVDLTDGLIAWYDFEDNGTVLVDESINGLDGVNKDSGGSDESVTVVSGLPGNAYPYISTALRQSNITDDVLLDFTGEFSITAWVNVADLSANRTIIAKNAEFALIVTTAGVLQMRVYENGGTDYVTIASPSSTIATGTDYFIEIKCNGGNLRDSYLLYLNRVAVSPTYGGNVANLTSGIADTSNAVNIGYFSTLAAAMNGKISQVVIYNNNISTAFSNEIYKDGDGVSY